MGWGEKMKGKVLKMAPRRPPQPTGPAALSEERLCEMASAWFQLEIEEGETSLLPILMKASQMELTDAGVAALSLFQEIVRLKKENGELKQNQKALVDTLNETSKGPHHDN